MREPKNQMLGTMEPPLMQLSVNKRVEAITIFVRICRKKWYFVNNCLINVWI